MAEHALDLMSQRDWVAIREVVHPYIRWTRADGSLVAGRLNLIASVEEGHPPLPPQSIELRDGQIYRWVEPAD